MTARDAVSAAVCAAVSAVRNMHGRRGVGCSFCRPPGAAKAARCLMNRDHGITDAVLRGARQGGQE